MSFVVKELLGYSVVLILGDETSMFFRKTKPEAEALLVELLEKHPSALFGFGLAPKHRIRTAQQTITVMDLRGKK